MKAEFQNWRSACLDEIAETFSGGTPSRENPTFYGGGIPWVKSGEVNLRRIRTSQETISPEALTHSSARIAPAGSVLVAMYGATAGKVAQLQIPAAINQAILAIHARHRQADGAFLFYALEAEAPALLRKTQGSGQPNLSGTILRQHVFLLPPLPEQRKIASILSSVDDAIEATQAVIDQLQVVKKAMMAELLTRGLPGRHTRFKQTEIGEVPEEWEVVRLGDHILVECGFAFKSTLFGNEGIPIVRMSNLKRGVIDLVEAARILPQYLPDHNANTLVVGDILLGLSGSLGPTGSLGNYARVQAHDLPAYLNQRLACLKTRNAERCCMDFLYTIVSSDLFRLRIEALATSLAQANISPRQIENLQWSLPPANEQRDIANAIEAIAHTIRLNSAHASALQTLRSTLLSTLLTGEIRVHPDTTT